MPFRHLLFNRRNGAPQRAPDQPAPSLDSVANFTLENEFVGWSEDHNYLVQPTANAYNPPAMMHEQQYAKQVNSIYQHPYDQQSMYSFHSIPYQNHPYDWDSSSLSCSSASDMRDTDVSSISQGSIRSSLSSTSHVDVMLDDSMSQPSLSRKPSSTELLCPALLTGGKCNPALCGPNAPCLQYVNNPDDVPPIEECVPDFSQQDSSMDESDSQPLDFTTPHSSPKHQRQRNDLFQTNNSIDPNQTMQTSTSDDKKPRIRSRKSSTKLADDVPTTKQTKVRRQRQAHSLVEKRYREQLNAKIQELHRTLQRAQFGNTSQPSLEQDDDPEADDDDRASLKVKKAAVLEEAMNYVHSTEMELRRKDEEIEKLKERVTLMENWIRTAGMGQQNMM